MSKRTRDEYQRSVEQDAESDVAGKGLPRANIEALREPDPEPVRATDFAINRPGRGVTKRCAPMPYGCGGIIEGDGPHVCSQGRYARPRA